MTNNFKSGFVSIVGRPNVGKSTLLNSLIGEKIAIISNKPQTTRNKVLGILKAEDYQIIFIDTPGIHTPKTKLGSYMEREVSESLTDVDAIIFITEPTTKNIEPDKKILNKLKLAKTPIILVINKIDTINKEKLFEVIEFYKNLADYTAIIPISALKKDGVNILIDEILKNINNGPMYFPDDMITDQPEKQIVAELIREKALRLLEKEVPHGVAVEIDHMKQEENIIKIGATIFCEKDSHKPIIIGKNGEMLKKIGTNSRIEIERLLGEKIFLEIWVKIKTDWRNNDFLLKNFGYK